MSGRRAKTGGIQIYARIRPTKRHSKLFVLDPDAGTIDFDIPKDTANGILINNNKTHHRFKFNSVLDMDCTQDDVFAVVAKDVVDSVLAGYNGTIFAYGQTGSGKTFTITGGTEKYSDRGIIPRTLSYIYEKCNQDSESQYNIYISFLEIYNESGNDLLSPEHESATSMKDLPKVSLYEDENGAITMKGLSMHIANNEEEALNLLFLGDTNRAISETAMNTQSSRSHCMFSIIIESRKAGSDIIRRSKLNLVDLAGSERVHKTGATGKLLTESKHINTSLHFLEVCIVALGEKNKKSSRHVPYRNSMMTSVLRDSLGGNCLTSMVATMSAERAQTEETISTARFAQRVALVQNSASVNEEADPKLVIKRLKAEIKALKEELAYYKQEDGASTTMTTTEYNHLRNKINTFLTDRDPKAVLSLGETFSFDKVRATFALFKEAFAAKEGGAVAGSTPHSNAVSGPSSAALSGSASGSGRGGTDSAEVARLRALLARRDDEIRILVQRQQRTQQDSDQPLLAMSRKQHKRSRNVEAPADKFADLPNLDDETLDDRKKCFEIYSKEFANKEAIDANKRELKSKYVAAKELGQSVNQVRKEITACKAAIEQIRLKKAVGAIAADDEPEADDAPPSPEEEAARAKITAAKSLYQEKFQALRKLKTEIEQIQKLLERGRKKLLKGFDSWYRRLLDKRKSERGATTLKREDRKPGRVVRGDGQRLQSQLAQARRAEGKRVLGASSDSAQLSAVTLGSVSGRSGSSPKPNSSRSAGPRMTGDDDTDKDIAEFYQASKLMRERRKR